MLNNKWEKQGSSWRKVQVVGWRSVRKGCVHCAYAARTRAHAPGRYWWRSSCGLCVKGSGGARGQVLRSLASVVCFAQRSRRPVWLGLLRQSTWPNWAKSENLGWMHSMCTVEFLHRLVPGSCCYLWHKTFMFWGRGGDNHVWAKETSMFYWHFSTYLRWLV